MAFPDFMTIVGIAVLCALAVLLGRFARETFSKWLERRERHSK